MKAIILLSVLAICVLAQDTAYVSWYSQACIRNGARKKNSKNSQKTKTMIFQIQKTINVFQMNLY